ncbi:hypothetical protein BHAOGJBA_0681 [Methylobacterium hispanicum]|uniref:histidine kinase n=1 Tax=Methylobacterium hispanicum TaxID=270350 RepID=A0AAV4ZGF0_9HYPH|nr:HWE histidine kinase domain-containing protein [Methylobacterium hispanicum]GJD87181.1 hypothetical protein BHAOGJBA_0681 [Methylobacterium hispanicum]
MAERNVAVEHCPPRIDVSACDREPIHALGSVQPFGFLLALSSDWIVSHASGSLEDHVGRSPVDVLGMPANEILGVEALHVLRGRLQTLRGPDQVERVFGLDLLGGGVRFDIALHRGGEGFLVEAEPHIAEELDTGELVRTLFARLQRTDGIDAYHREAVRQMRVLTGFDRAMVYRFAEDGSGEVVAESARAGLESYLGLRYPASDIPQQARRLYERNPIRLIADVDAEVSPVHPTLDPHGRPLDLSLAALRAVSPVHIEYLRNMGVAASMSVSILRDGRLWGLLACHHGEPRHLSMARRSASELFGQMYSWALEGREREAERAADARARDLHNRLMGAIASRDASVADFEDYLGEMRGVVACDGIALCVEGRVACEGVTPDVRDLPGLTRFLNRTATSRVYATHALGGAYEPAAAFADRASGILAIPVSREPRDYLLFFRREVARTVTWAGKPEKVLTLSDDGWRLSPRKSFAAWEERVRGTATPWGASDLRVAEALRVTLLEVVLRLTDSSEKERRSAQERQEVLIAELNHRVRNILNLIRGVVGQSRGQATTAEEFAAVVGGRIQALARAHDQITAMNWTPGSLRDLIRLEAEAYLSDKACRVHVAGEDVLLEPQAMSTMALVIHEMTTNSAKYGALADSRGRVDVSLARTGDGALVMDWAEAGGPPVRPPTRRGFGSVIVERSVPYELKGEAGIRYEPGGVEARFVVPAAFVHEAPAALAVPEAANANEDIEAAGLVLRGTVLLVEDNMIIALEGEEMLLGLGARAVETAASVRDALRIVETRDPDFALLDMNLGTETSLPVAERLRERGTPFAFATGYGEQLRLPDGLRHVPVVRKPYDAQALRRAFGH